jgi:16S rRNA (adenine1518-N6/adenine1519-N6)-dimethyltransferase
VNLSELLIFLRQIGRRPNRGLSQNFLIDENIALKIVRTAAVSAGDHVLEIGPGPGALTSCLLDAGAKVFAIEKDPVFAEQLSRLGAADRLISISGDFLKASLTELPSPLKVVANIPYHITTPILEKLFHHSGLFSTLTLMVQKEVAGRMSASHGSKEFSSLALFLQYHAKIAASFPVAASCFYPKPNIDSTVLHLALRPAPLENSAPFFNLVRRGFRQRRKMLRATLRSLIAPELLQKALRGADAPSDARPEALSLEQWLAFYKILSEEAADCIF